MKSRAEVMADLAAWDYIVKTYWYLDYDQFVKVINQHKTLGSLLEAAERARDGMVAT